MDDDDDHTKLRIDGFKDYVVLKTLADASAFLRADHLTVEDGARLIERISFWGFPIHVVPRDYVEKPAEPREPTRLRHLTVGDVFLYESRDLTERHVYLGVEDSYYTLHRILVIPKKGAMFVVEDMAGDHPICRIATAEQFRGVIKLLA